MIETISSLRRRLKTIHNTRHITHAMEIVSAAKLRRAEMQYKAGKLYYEKMQEIISRFARNDASLESPFFRKESEESALCLIFTSDKGLCGSFNHTLVEYAHKKISEMNKDKLGLFFIGKKGREYFKIFPEHYEIYESFIDLYGCPSKEVTEKISSYVINSYLDKKNKINTVYIFSYKLISRSQYEPIMQKLLPVSIDNFSDKSVNTSVAVNYLMEPCAYDIVEKMVPQYLKTKLYTILLEQRSCEHSARMISMNNATKNCEELSDEITLKMNKARQTIITREIMDIVGGAEALK